MSARDYLAAALTDLRRLAAPAACQVTVGLANDRRLAHPICGQPAVRYGLCSAHYADRVRLGGTR
jgi:hypothetical protein